MAEFAAAGITITNTAERIRAWNAKYADAKIVIKPLKLPLEFEQAADAIFGPVGPQRPKADAAAS